MMIHCCKVLLKYEMCKNSSECSVKHLFASWCLSLSHISCAHAISCNSTVCVITCSFTSFVGLRSTLPNHVKLSCSVQWQSGTLVWDVPRGKHACVSTEITVCLKWLLDVAQTGRTARLCSAPALIFTMLRWTFYHHKIDNAGWLAIHILSA